MAENNWNLVDKEEPAAKPSSLFDSLPPQASPSVTAQPAAQKAAFLDRQTYFIREHLGMLKFANSYDILDPATGEQIGVAKERPGNFILLLRLLIDKKVLPTKVFVHEGRNPDSPGKVLFAIHKGLMLLRTRINVVDPQGKVLGWFVSKLFSLSGGFTVFNAGGREVGQMKGDWKGGEYRFLGTGDSEIGTVSKQWGGVGKELFTTADNYVVNVRHQPDPATNTLLLAAGLALDIVFKEK
jgi:uncharacterized protein YxjI